MAAPAARNSRKTLSITWLGLLPIIILVPWWTVSVHYWLPEPKISTHLSNGQPQLSEAAILAHAEHLSETIGYRTVGTHEHALGDAWAVEQVKSLDRLCQKVGKGKINCEWDRQSGSGSHKFDIVNRIVYKSYQNLSNIVLRISSPNSPDSKTRSVLINAHLDSTLPAPGAADDALCVGIILEVARVLIEQAGRDEWNVGWSIIFLINNAEESLQDASHLFSTAHPWASTVRAVVNLEAAGTMGPELLFQATSEEMVDVYRNVPYPYGTVIANDIFASGIIMSDTDFRQFDQYLSVPGLDMAVVGHSYFYHTSKDLVRYIQPGVAQRFSENVLEIIKRATARPAEGLSILERVKKFDQPVEGIEFNPATRASRRPDVVFYSLLGLGVVVYSGTTAKLIYAVWALFYIGFISWSRRKTDLTVLLREHLRAMGIVVFSLLRSLLYANVLAFLLSTVLGKPLSWFSHEWRPVLLYAFPTLLGLIEPLPSFLSSLRIGAQRERTLLSSTLLFHIILANVLQWFGIGSAVLPFLISLGIGIGFISGFFITDSWSNVNPLTYLIGSAIPLALGLELGLGLLDVFVPLTGRMGPVVPAEHIIATPIAVIFFVSFPCVIPLASRLHTRDISLIIRTLRITGSLIAIYFTLVLGAWPFDSMHPRRVLISLKEDISQGTFSLSLAAMDMAAGSEELAYGLNTVSTLGFSNNTIVEKAPRLKIDHWNTDFEALFPIGELLAPFSLTPPAFKAEKLSTWANSRTFGVTLLRSSIDHNAGTRKLSLQMHHRGVIWTVLAFDAHIVSWSLSESPPDSYTRHHIKESSFYGEKEWNLEIEVKLDPVVPEEFARSTTSADKIEFDYSGIVEQGMWPSKKHEWLAEKDKVVWPNTKTTTKMSMELFSRMDEWLEKEKKGSVDAFMMHSLVKKTFL